MRGSYVRVHPILDYPAVKEEALAWIKERLAKHRSNEKNIKAERAAAAASTQTVMCCRSGEGGGAWKGG